MKTMSLIAGAAHGSAVARVMLLDERAHETADHDREERQPEDCLSVEHLDDHVGHGVEFHDPVIAPTSPGWASADAIHTLPHGILTHR